MSIEDINYLKQNSIKQSYTFLVDSKARDRRIFPTPSEYVIDFTVPFRNVIGIEVVDVSIPKTMYNIDYNNNRIYYYISPTNDEIRLDIIKDEYGNDIYDKSLFSYIQIPPGDYITSTFIDQLRLTFLAMGLKLTMNSVDTPAELTNLIYFSCDKPFILDMHQSTMSEILGFDMFTNSNEKPTYRGQNKYSYTSYNNKVGFEKLFHSCPNTTNANGLHSVYAPGMMYLLGNKYIVLKCPEIEQHLYRSLSYSKYNLGLAKMRINNYGYNDEKTSFLKVPIREFHPIGKLSKMTLRFETDDGKLYDFKGVNHNIVFALYYYEPKQENAVRPSILNPDYNPNFTKYLYTQEEQEGESDDDDSAINFSRDNIDIYKKRELQYNSSGIENKNKIVASEWKQQMQRNIVQNAFLQQKVSDTLSSKDTSSENSDVYTDTDSD